MQRKEYCPAAAAAKRKRRRESNLNAARRSRQKASEDKLRMKEDLNELRLQIAKLTEEVLIIHEKSRCGASDDSVVSESDTTQSPFLMFEELSIVVDSVVYGTY